MPTSSQIAPAAAPVRHPWHIANWEIPEVWVRFLLALVGLILAFASALFSTVSRESGNIWATLILASAALLLATIVGVTTVPYLARRVVAARIREVFHYDVTRAGITYIVITMLIGIAGLVRYGTGCAATAQSTAPRIRSSSGSMKRPTGCWRRSDET